jgi:hypothetical protein
MTRHLADKRAPSDGGRIRAFLRIARGEGDRPWQALWRSPRPAPAAARRTAEFLRIDRGRRT